MIFTTTILTLVTNKDRVSVKKGVATMVYVFRINAGINLIFITLTLTIVANKVRVSVKNGVAMILR